MTFPAATAPPSRTPVDRTNIQDILPLQANQLALLLYRDSGTDPGFLQVRFRLEGSLDVERYRRAWNATTARHPALRSSIRGRVGGDPLAIVWRRVDVPFVVEDLRSRPDLDETLARRAHADAAVGLDLGAPPAMRLLLLRTDDRVHEVMWTCHHLFIDGWSASIVLEDVMDAYRRDSSGAGDVETTEALRAYSQWSSERDEDSLRHFWSEALAGYPGQGSVRYGEAPSGPGHGDLTVDIPDDLTDGVVATASRANVTPAVVLQAAWAMVVSIASGGDDVAFGTAVSGRNAEIPGMDRLVGFFSNTVPVRVRLPGAEPFSEVLAELRDRQFGAAQHEHASIADIHRWSDVPGHRSMFDSFVVIENFPSGDAAGDEVVQREFRSGLTTVYPVTIAIGMSSPWFLHLRFDRSRCTDEAAHALVDQLIGVLRGVVDRPQSTVDAVRKASGDVISHLVHPFDGNASTRAFGRSGHTETELRLAAIWRDHLDLDDVDVETSYFDLGGTSLGAVRLFGSIRSEFGIELPLSALLEHPTIEGLAGLLDGVESGANVEWTCLVPLQPAGSRPPIAAVHGGAGHILFYRSVAEHLGTDQPVYGLQPVGLDGFTPPLDSVPEMAARYLDELRRAQPTGPYRLIGFCFGGIVCLEMAAQLEEQGHIVDYLGIIDGGLPIIEARYERPADRVRYLMASRGFAGLLRAGWRRVTWRIGEWWKENSRSDDVERPLDNVPVALACRRAFRTFDPRPVTVPVTLIRSTEKQAGEGTDWDFTWETVSPRVDVRTVDADHRSLFEGRGAEELAATIERSLPVQEP